MQDKTMDYILNERPCENSKDHENTGHLKVCLNLCEPIEDMKSPKDWDRLP